MADREEAQADCHCTVFAFPNSRYLQDFLSVVLHLNDFIKWLLFRVDLMWLSSQSPSQMCISPAGILGS